MIKLQQVMWDMTDWNGLLATRLATIPPVAEGSTDVKLWVVSEGQRNCDVYRRRTKSENNSPPPPKETLISNIAVVWNLLNCKTCELRDGGGGGGDDYDNNNINKRQWELYKKKRSQNIYSAHVECENKSDTSNNMGDWNHLTFTQTVPEQHTGN